jgi:tight adherence protein C
MPGMLINIQLLLSVIIGLSVLVLFFGVRMFVTPVDSADRIQQLMSLNSGETPTLRQLEMHGSFYRRVLKPLLISWLQQLGRLAPQRNLEQLHQKLEAAGFPANLNVADFLGLKILMSILLAVFIAGLTYLVRPDFSWLMLAGVALVFGFVGFVLPNLWLSSRIRRRKTEIRKSLPDALDMLTICVGAGVGLSGAMQQVTEAWNNALCEEFARVLTEVKLGRSRIEALESMAKRSDVDEVRSFVTSIVLADKLGVSISNTLRIQSQQMRIARRQKAEEAAREASIKMLFPLVFLIFPAMFAVILGPAVPLLLETLTGF